MRNYVSLLPQFLQYLASVGFNVPHDTREAEVSNAPHLMQCFAPAMRGALHLEHLPMFGDSSAGLGGASALGENTSDRITTSPTVEIVSFPRPNSRGRSLSPTNDLYYSYGDDRERHLRSRLPHQPARQHHPMRYPRASN